jgi:hypothetical protein
MIVGKPNNLIMKKIRDFVLKHHFCTVFAISFLFFSCSQNENASPNNSQATKEISTKEIQNIQLNPSDFKIIGNEHNRILELTFASLEKELLSDNGSAKIKNKNGKYYSSELSTIDEVLEYTKGVIKKEISKNNSKYSKSSIIQKSVNVSLNGVDAMFEMKTPLMENDKLYNRTIESKLTSKVKLYLSDLNALLRDQDTSLVSLKNRIHILETTISHANLTEGEQAILYSATNTASSTLTYWNENYNNWVTTLPDDTPSGPHPPRPTGLHLPKPENDVTHPYWKSIGIADVAGAIGGAVGAAVINIMPGPGQVAYASAIVGTALGGSVTQAVTSILSGNCSIIVPVKGNPIFGGQRNP